MRSVLTKISVRYGLFLMAIVGLLISGYLWLAYVSGGPIVCGDGHGCETVRSSLYAKHFGLPTPVYGVIFYLCLGVSAALWDGQKIGRMYSWLLLVTGVGLAVSAYLTYLEAFVVEAWCSWCVVSAGLTVLAFGIVWGKLPRQTL